MPEAGASAFDVIDGLGAHKTDANSFQPLSKDVRSSLQAEVNRYYELFLNAVAQAAGSA